MDMKTRFNFLISRLNKACADLIADAFSVGILDKDGNEVQNTSQFEITCSPIDRLYLLSIAEREYPAGCVPDSVFMYNIARVIADTAHPETTIRVILPTISHRDIDVAEIRN
ncbi:MAG: hypothetical protein AAF570_14300 [Bacteroidota bacterium]